MIKFRLRVLLAERDMKQNELSRITGIRLATVSTYCRNSAKTITLRNIDSICKALNCSPADLFEVVE